MLSKRGTTPPVGEVAAGALRAALEDVPGDDARGQPVPVVGRPAEAWIIGASVMPVSVKRPVTITRAPMRSASTTGPAPK